MAETIKYIPIYNIKRANRQAGFHFFEPATMRFFDSRTGQEAYQGAGGTFFVSSEQFHGSNGHSAARHYSVRKFDPLSGDIDTVGGFQAYRTSAAARQAALKLAHGG
jgi:hypothetical protein